MSSARNISITIHRVVICLMMVTLHPAIPPTAVGVDAFTIISNESAGSKNTIRLYASEEREPEDEDKQSSYQGYNPFTGKYQSPSSSSSSPSTSFSSSSKTSSISASRSIGDARSASTIISIRKTRMQELTRQLLEAVVEDSNSSSLSSSSPLEPSTLSTPSTSGSGSAVRVVLDDYKDFLLEPLEEQDAVLDPDSIYTPNMTRQERYEAYRQEMDRRLSQARNKQAHAVLSAMKDYVLEFE